MTTKALEHAEAKIGEMVRRIVEQFDPDKIILFGSFASGTADADSDVDLLVVMQVPTSKRKQAAQIDLTLADVGLPKDVIVVTPEEVRQYRDVVGSIIYPALREGKVLYERAAWTSVFSWSCRHLPRRLCAVVLTLPALSCIADS